MHLLIQGGRVFTGAAMLEADIRIRDGLVAEVGPALSPDGAEVVNATGCVTAPSFCDLHVHLREPGFSEKETIATGTAAAAAGGFTTVCAMPNVHPVPDSAATLAPQLALIKQSALIEVLPYGSITRGEKGAQKADYAALFKDVCGFSDDGVGVQSADMMRSAMQDIAALGGLVTAHCEDESLLPQNGTCVQAGSAFAAAHGYTGFSNQSEAAEVERDVRLAAETGCRLHICHTSATESFAAVRAGKAAGAPVTCEVTPHNLLLCCDDITEDDGRFKMNPPLRHPADRDAARVALADGTVDAIATDHAPHTPAQKAGGFAKAANGVVGLETAFPALYSGLVQPGLLELTRLLHLLGNGPRTVLGRSPLTLEHGAEASLVVLDLATAAPVEPETFLTKGRATPFAGQVLAGWPVLTLYKGQAVFQQMLPDALAL